MPGFLQHFGPTEVCHPRGGVQYVRVGGRRTGLHRLLRLQAPLLRTSWRSLQRHHPDSSGLPHRLHSARLRNLSTPRRQRSLSRPQMRRHGIVFLVNIPLEYYSLFFWLIDWLRLLFWFKNWFIDCSLFRSIDRSIGWFIDWRIHWLCHWSIVAWWIWENSAFFKIKFWTWKINYHWALFFFSLNFVVGLGTVRGSVQSRRRTFYNYPTGRDHYLSKHQETDHGSAGHHTNAENHRQIVHIVRNFTTHQAEQDTESDAAG